MATDNHKYTLLGIATRVKSRAPMITHHSINVTRASRLQNDLRGKPGKRQVTVLSKEQWLDACEEIGQIIPWTIRRANLFVEGLTFGPNDVGKHIQIGSVILEIIQETDPCPRMNEQVPGLTQALMPNWRGGVCCKVFQDGQVKLGDKIELLSEL